MAKGVSLRQLLPSIPHQGLEVHTLVVLRQGAIIERQIDEPNETDKKNTPPIASVDITATTGVTTVVHQALLVPFG